jgi:hypothetical protein
VNHLVEGQDEQDDGHQSDQDEAKEVEQIHSRIVGGAYAELANVRCFQRLTQCSLSHSHVRPAATSSAAIIFVRLPHQQTADSTDPTGTRG